MVEENILGTGFYTVMQENAMPTFLRDAQEAFFLKWSLLLQGKISRDSDEYSIRFVKGRILPAKEGVSFDPGNGIALLLVTQKMGRTFGSSFKS